MSGISGHGGACQVEPDAAQGVGDVLLFFPFGPPLPSRPAKTAPAFLLGILIPHLFLWLTAGSRAGFPVPNFICILCSSSSKKPGDLLPESDRSLQALDLIRTCACEVLKKKNRRKIFHVRL